MFIFSSPSHRLGQNRAQNLLEFPTKNLSWPGIQGIFLESDVGLSEHVTNAVRTRTEMLLLLFLTQPVMLLTITLRYIPSYWQPITLSLQLTPQWCYRTLPTDLWWDAVIRVRAVIWALPVDAHLEKLVDGSIHSTVVGTQHALNHLIVHRGEHGLEVLHGLVELQASDLPVGPAVVKLPTAATATSTSTSTASGTSIATTAPEKASHPWGWASSGNANLLTGWLWFYFFLPMPPFSFPLLHLLSFSF